MSTAPARPPTKPPASPGPETMLVLSMSQKASANCRTDDSDAPPLTAGLPERHEMTITLTREIEEGLTAQAKVQGVTSERLALEKLHQEFAVAASEQRPQPFEPQDEWERRLLQAASPAGVSLSNEAVSSEGIY